MWYRSIAIRGPEPDPTNDVDGHDAAYKLSILISILEGRHFHPDNVRRTSLRGISAGDLTGAAARGEGMTDSHQTLSDAE